MNLTLAILFRMFELQYGYSYIGNSSPGLGCALVASCCPPTTSTTCRRRSRRTPRP